MILVTGGAGFIGSNLVAALDARGERVAVCDRLGSGNKWRNLAKRDLENIVLPEHLTEFLRHHEGDVEAIFHLGAISTTTETDAGYVAVAGCSSVTGSYIDVEGTGAFTLELKSGGAATLTFNGTPLTCTYSANGNKVYDKASMRPRFVQRGWLPHHSV